MWRRKTSSLEEQPHIVRLSAQPRGFRRKGWHHLRHLLAPLALTLCGSATLTQDRPTATTPVNSEQFISETHNRVVFDKEAFSFGPVPYWSEGYLISIKTESFSPGTINARLFGRGGSKSAEVAFWFPGSERVGVTSAAVTPDGGIVGSGEADKADGTRASFIALANFKGQVTNVIQTGDFYPRNICVAPDGSIWAFGGMMWSATKSEPFQDNVLRRFDFRRGELASHIPESTFPKNLSMQPDALSFIRCSADKVVVYSTPASLLIELPYKDDTPRIYNVSVPQGLRVRSLAVTHSGAIYGSLLDRKVDSGKGGMYSLVLDEASCSAFWHPVNGAVGRWTDQGIVFRVLGADGENLVVNRAGDPVEHMALHWMTASRR